MQDVKPQNKLQQAAGLGYGRGEEENRPLMKRADSGLAP